MTGDDSFIVKTPVLICIELAFAIGPAIVVSIHLKWAGIITGLAICAIAIIIPVAAKEMDRFLDGGYQTDATAPGPPVTTTELGNSRSGNYYRGNPHRRSRCGSVRDRRRWPR